MPSADCATRVAAKKELLLRARYDALAASGGKRAVKKAIEKRQKKVSQKEKKSRPSFASRPEREMTGGSKRRAEAGEAPRGKRLKFS